MPRRYLWRLLVAADQALNTLAGGDPDETISSRAAKASCAGKRWGRWLCAALDTLDPHHCDDAREDDEGRPGCQR